MSDAAAHSSGFCPSTPKPNPTAATNADAVDDERKRARVVVVGACRELLLLLMSPSASLQARVTEAK